MIHRVIAAAAFLMLASPSLHAAVGRTAGDGGTSASGEATYKIPIRVPPGINGVTPELALAYSHRNTEGTAGVGWDVSGLSAIVRCADTLAQNGGSDAVSLTTYDEYCVDGNQLRLTSGTQGTAGSKYRSEVDDITRYTAYGTAGNGPQYFIAEAKSGLIYYYGNSTNSRIESLASGFTTTVLVWNLSKIVDRSGNEIVFTWQEDGAPDGEYRILTIDYGGNAGQGVSARYRVNFQYGGLPASDIEMRYAAGGKLEETKRLTEIKVWYTEPATDELYRSYTLAYESDVSSTGRGRLANVQECAGNTGNCFEPTTFSYWDGDNDLDSEQYSGSTISGTNALSVDINGDGHTDLVYASGGTWWYQLANPAGAYLSAINSGISATSHTEAIAIDYNSDGLEDILVPSGGYWTAILGSATYPHLLSPVTTNAPDASNAGNAAALDLNGDGRDDLVWGENIGAINSRIRARYRDDTGFSTTLYSLFTGSASWYVAGPTLFGSPYRQGRNNFFDVNGDGLADVTYVSVQVVQQGGEPIDKYYTDVYLGGFRGIYSVTTAPSGLTSGLSIDMNGDGYTDVVYRLGNGNLKFRLSNGKSFGSVGSAPSLSGLDFNRAVAMDWNGDGMQDLLIPETETSGSGEVWKYMKSTGDGFENAAPTPVSANNVLSPRRIDKNGDGLDDLGYVVSGIYASKNHAGPYPDLLETVTDAYGNSITFNYTSITQGSYTKGTGAAYPTQDYVGPLQVVQSEVRSTGIDGGTYTLSYSYSGALLNVHGRGLGGFESREITDSRTGIKTIEEYKREYPFRGRPKSILTTQSNGKKIHETIYTWSSQPGGSGYEVYNHPYASEIIERRYEVEVGGAYDEAFISEKVTSISVDLYGTPTSIETETTEQSGANGLQAGITYTELIQHSQITNSTTNWCLGKPGTTTWTNSYNLTPGSQITRTVDRIWDTAYYCRLMSEITEPLSSDYKVTRSYGYDSFGNINSDTTTGITMAARTTTVNWGTKGHFPQTVTNPEGEQTTIAWNYRFGLRSSVTDPNGEAVSYLYDDFGRMTRATRPDGTHTIYGLSACNSGNSYCGTGYAAVVSKVHVSSRGSDASVIRYEEYFLDQLDREVQADRQVLGGPISHTRTTYDDHGRIEEQSVPDFSTSPSDFVVAVYDLIGRPESVTRPDNATTLYSYQGLKTVITDPLNRNTTKYADVKGRVLRSQDHANYYQDFEFDAFGSLTGVFDSSSNTLFTADYEYGIGPMRTYTWDMDLGGWGYEPNALGEVESYTDANGKTFGATFDRLSRPTSRTDPGNAYTSATTTTWTWGTSAANNNIGKLVSIESGSHEEAYSYDAYGRLSQRTTTADGTHLTNYSYNPTSGLLDTYTFPTSTSGVRVKLKYEYSYGFVNKISDYASPTTVFWEASTADARGRVIHETLENDLQSIRGYDAVTGLVDYIQTGTNGDKQDNEYTWNKVGSLKTRTDHNRNLTETFFYDSRHRLDFSELDDGLTTVQNVDLTYNAWGNITKKTDVCSTSWSYTHPTKKHAVTNACGMTFEYDENGNQVKRNADDLEWYSYNYPSKIENGSRYHQFFYDGFRNRWKQVYNNGSASETTIYVGGNFEIRSEGGIDYYRHYIRAEGRLVAIKVRATGGVDENKTVLTDHLGSIVEVLDESGNLDISESFAAYGGRRDPADWSGGISNEAELADLTQRGFTAQTHLDESTFVHLGGRVLDTLTGRFLSPDPTVPHPGDTQSFNRYSYLRNDPLSGVDPTGFFDSRFHEDWTFNLQWSRSHRRNAHTPPPSGCQVTSPQGCYGKGGVKAVIDMIVDKVIGPLPSYGWDDSLIMYFTDPQQAQTLADDDYERVERKIADGMGITGIYSIKRVSQSRIRAATGGDPNAHGTVVADPDKEGHYQILVDRDYHDKDYWTLVYHEMRHVWQKTMGLTRQQTYFRGSQVELTSEQIELVSNMLEYDAWKFVETIAIRENVRLNDEWISKRRKYYEREHFSKSLLGPGYPPVMVTCCRY